MTTEKFYPGQTVLFIPSKTNAKPLKAVIQYELGGTNGKTLIKIGTDPFSTHVSTNQLQKGNEMATTPEPVVEAAPRKRGRPRKDAVVAPAARTKRKVTKPVEAVEETPVAKKRGRPAKTAAKAPRASRKVTAEVEAPAPAKRSAGRPKKAVAAAEAPKRRGRPPKATASTAPTKKVAVAKPARKPVKVTVTENPFRPGSNSHAYCAALMKGGTRRAIAQRLAQKITVTPWSKEISAEDQISEIDTRLNLTAHQLKSKFGWTITRSGRGMDSKIRVQP